MGQCLGCARLFFHRPDFAVLDECMAAMSDGVQQLVFFHAARQRIGLLVLSQVRAARARALVLSRASCPFLC